MGGFNPINLIINTMNISSIYQTQIQGGRVNNNALQSSFQKSAPVPNQPPSSSAVNVNYEGLSALNQTLISTVEIEQRANYVKNLLNLPEDFSELIKLIQGEFNPDAQALKDLSKLLYKDKINLTMLTSILSKNSKEAVQKLMTTIMSVSKMGSNDLTQLKELMGLLSSANAPADSAQTVKNLLMLYLPWLPLTIRNELNLDFDIDIFDKIKGADKENENAETIKIMIETANFGNVLASLEMAPNNEVDVFINANETFPEKKVLSLFKKENKTHNLRTNISVEKNKKTGLNEAAKQNIQITSSNYVSGKLVLAAHSLIKIIIEVDSEDFIINEENEG